MSQHLNRLNAEESFEWDKIYEKFCKTGMWEEYEMKQCKKWWDRVSMEDDRDYEDYAQRGWRAALREVLTQLNNIYDGDFDNSEIVKWINKELGDEDEQKN